MPPESKQRSVFQEEEFQEWYKGWAEKIGLNPDPDDPRQKYDYRAAYMAGVEPEISPEDQLYHWPSKFKAPDHPNRFVKGIDTITGKPVATSTFDINKVPNALDVKLPVNRDIRALPNALDVRLDPVQRKFDRIPLEDVNLRLQQLNAERAEINAAYPLVIKTEDQKARLAEIQEEIDSLMPLGMPERFYKGAEGIQETYPYAIAGAGVSIGIQSGLRGVAAGLTSRQALAKGAITTGVTIGADVGIEMIAEPLMEENPWLGLGVAVGLGLISGGFVESVIEERSFRALNRLAPNFFSKNLSGIAQSNTKNISQQAKARLQVLASRMDDGDYASVREAQDLLKRELYRDGGDPLEFSSLSEEKLKVPSRLQVSREALKKSFADVSEKDVEDIQALAQIDSFKGFDTQFNKIKNRVNNKLALEAYRNHPITPLIQNVKRSGGFSRQTVEHMIGKKATTELNQKYPKLITKNGKVNPVHKAVANDYNSVEEMFYDMAIMPNITGVKRSVARSMQYDWDVLYMDELATRVGGTELKMWERIGGKKLVDRARSLARREAELLGTRPKLLKEIVDDVNYIRKVADKGIKATERMTKAEARLAQLVRVETLKVSTENKKRITRINGELRNSIRDRGIPYEYQAQIQKYLQPYAKVNYKVPEGTRSLRNFLDDKIADDVPSAKMLQKKYEDILELPQMIPTQGDLTLDQYARINELMKDLRKLGKYETEITKVTERQALRDYTSTIKQTADDVFQRNQENITQRRYVAAPTTAVSRAKNYLTDKFAEWFGELKRPEFVLRELDGWEDFGQAQKMFVTAKLAEDAEVQITKAITNRWEDIIKKYAKSLGKNRLSSKFWNKMFHDSMGFFSTTRERMITIAAMTGNTHNKAAMLNSLKVDEVVINRFLRENMTPEDWTLVKDIWKMTDEMYEMIADVYTKMTGGVLPKVDNYFPIIPDYSFSKKGIKESLDDVFMDTPHFRKIPPQLQKQFTQQRVGGSDAIMLNFDAFAKHLRDVAHTVSHWEATTDLKKIVHDRVFKDAVVANLGKDKHDVLKQWVDDLIKPAPSDANFLRKLRANVTVANLGWKFSVAMVQPLSMISAIPRVGAKNLMQSLTRLSTNPRAMYNAINEVSEQMMFRNHAWNRDIGDMLNITQMKRFKKAGALDRNIFFGLIRSGDVIGAYSTWYAGWLKGMKRFNGDSDKAVKYADQSVRMTQPQSSLKDLPNIMKGPEWKRLLTMFYSYYSVLHNQAAEILRRYRFGDMSMTDTIIALNWMYTVPPVASSIIKEGSVNPKDYAKYTFTHVSGGLPVVRDLISSLVMGYDYTITPIADVPITAMRTFNRIGKDFQAISEGTYDPEFKDYYSATKLISYTFGVPVKSVMQVVAEAHRSINENENFSDPRVLRDILVKRRKEE